MKTKSIITIVVTAFLFAACAGTSTKESTGDYIDDAAITTKVKTELLKAKETSGTAISVETFKGTVQLSGFVDTRDEKMQAQEIAGKVDGVKAVDNKLSVKGK